MQHKTLKLIVLATGSLLVGSAAYAAGTSGTAAAGNAPPLPAPPGPYVSSRPYLTPGGGSGAGEADAWSSYYPAPYQRPYVGPGRYWAPPRAEKQGAGDDGAPEDDSVWRGPRDLPPVPVKKREAKAGSTASGMAPPPAWQPPPYAYDAGQAGGSAPPSAAGQHATPAKAESGNNMGAEPSAPPPAMPGYPYYGQAPRWGYPPPPPYRSPYGPRW